jgi:hypothetical protein
MVTAERQRDVRCLCECLERVVRTWDKGSIGARRSCLREACRPGLGSLLWEELVFDGVLRSRPGDGRLDDEAVSGLTTGMVSSAQLKLDINLDSGACAGANACIIAWRERGKLPTWTSHERQVWEIGQDWKLKASFAFLSLQRLEGLIIIIMTYSPAPSPTLEAVPGRPEDLSNSKLVKVSGDLMVGLMGSDMSASRFCGSVRVRVGSAMASGTKEGVCVASQGACRFV